VGGGSQFEQGVLGGGGCGGGGGLLETGDHLKFQMMLGQVCVCDMTYSYV